MQDEQETQNAGKEEKPYPQTKDSWSDCGQVFFIGGKGYGLIANDSTICLGNKEDILTAFNTGELGPDLAPIQKQVLMGIIEYRKEVMENGTRTEPQLKRSSDIRSRASGGVKRRVADTKRPALRKRLPCCAP